MEKNKLFNIAFYLAIFTIFYNLVEGAVSTLFGFEDESLTLFGFGVDSFIEVISGTGIARMIIRIRQNPESNRDKYERTALKVTGFSFYILVAGLIITAVYNIWTGHTPKTTFWGLVISLISIACMVFLITAKKKIGRQLNSEAILADAECNKVCVYMSVILLLSSALYELFEMPYIDSIGTLGLAYFSFKEGKECFEKAESSNLCCSSCASRDILK